MPLAQILVHENSTLKLESIESALRDSGCKTAFTRSRSRDEFLATLESLKPSLVLCDFDFGGLNSLEAVEHIQQGYPHTDLIVLSESQGEDRGIECIRRGATDCVPKNSPERLLAVIRSSLERQRLRREHQRLERQNDLLFQLLPNFLCVLTEGGHLVQANPAWGERLGISRKEWMGRPLCDFVDPNDRSVFLAWWRDLSSAQVIIESSVPDCEVRMIGRDFAPRYVTWTARLHGGENLIYASGLDTNDRHVAESSLRDSEARFRAMADSAPTFIWISEVDQSRSYCNQPWLDFTGRSLDEVRQNGWEESVHPEDRSRVLTIYRNGFTACRSFRVEYRLRRFDGHYRWVLDNGSPNYNHERSLVGFIGSCIDINDQHEAEMRLTQRAIKQAALAGFGRFALAQHSFEDGVREAARLVNETLHTDISQVLSLSPTDLSVRLIAGHGFDLSPLPLPAGEIDPEALTTGSFLLNDKPEFFPGRSTHGGLGVVSGCAVSISSAKRPFGFLTALSSGEMMFARDTIDFLQGIANILGSVHQREFAQAALEESEQKLLQSQKMEAVGILAGGVAHDFNNLLTAIRCYGDLLHEDLADMPDLKSRASEILKATARASSLTGQLLAFSRKQIIQPEILDLNNIITDLRDLVRSLLSENIKLVVNHANAPVHFEADRNQFDQVVINLCINARDAMPQGGTITIDIGSRHLEAGNANGLTPGDYVELRINDTGTGIAADLQSRLFQPFVTTKPKGRGTGLGLATCAVIIKSCQGAISFESEVGKGTTFFVLLPQLPALTNSLVAHEETFAGEGTERILLVEDDEAIRTVTTAILESLGYEVHPVAGGADALELCENAGTPPFDLLLTDVIMPNMSGRELAERFSKIFPKISILFMSGYVGDSKILQAVQDAGARFLEKPFTRTTLARKVRESLDHSPRQLTQA
ncbi:MAG: response regulator [Opitutaceae bacterium]|nr:response regulator [Opitutaceae bacterium]